MEKRLGPDRPYPGSIIRTALVLACVIAGGGVASARESAAPELPCGPYFGQSPPGTVPSVFAPGIISLADRYEYVIAFSVDGTECCFGVTNSDWSSCDLYCSRQEGGVWSQPSRAAFQKGGDGWLPSFTPDGRRLLFSSGRPDIMQGANAYMCEKTAEGWSDPTKLAPPINSPTYDWRPTVTAGGTLYFSSDRPGGQGEADIYRAVPVDGAYRTVENLGPPVNSPHLDSSPCISLDERFLVFESWRPGGHGKGDLYISYRTSDGAWTSPQNLGPTINTDQIEDGGYVSPDGKYFFFNRRSDWVTEEQTDLYWVDIRAILRPYVLNPSGEASAVVGKRLVMRLPAGQFADLDDDALTYSAAAAAGAPLPSWLAFDPETRTMSGTPRTEGSVEVVITATDSLGSNCSDGLTIRIVR